MFATDVLIINYREFLKVLIIKNIFVLHKNIHYTLDKHIQINNIVKTSLHDKIPEDIINLILEYSYIVPTTDNWKTEIIDIKTK